MTISIKHKFTSLKGDGSDATLLRPSNWNDEHDLTLAQDKILGRVSSGTGAVEEITCTPVARSILDDTTISAILDTLGISPPTTGDLRLTLKTSAPTGWLMMAEGTIGNASSGATLRANADTQTLYQLIWDGVSQTNAPVTTSAGAASTRGASAAADFAANKRLALPHVPGRALVGAGAGTSLTSRALGEFFGNETETLTAAQIPTLNLSGSGSCSGSISGSTPNGFTVGSGSGVGGGGSFGIQVTGNVTGTFSGTCSVTGTTTGTSGQAHANIQPSVGINVMVKL